MKAPLDFLATIHSLTSGTRYNVSTKIFDTFQHAFWVLSGHIFVTNENIETVLIPFYSLSSTEVFFCYKPLQNLNILKG